MVRLILLVAFVAVAAIAITGLIRTIQDVTAADLFLHQIGRSVLFYECFCKAARSAFSLRV